MVNVRYAPANPYPHAACVCVMMIQHHKNMGAGRGGVMRFLFFLGNPIQIASFDTYHTRHRTQKDDILLRCYLNEANHQKKELTLLDGSPLIQSITGHNSP